MITLDELFQTRSDTPPHPRLRTWKNQLSLPGVKATLELDRPTPVLGLAQTDMVLHFTKNGQSQPDEIVVWDDDLNAGLVKFGVLSINRDQEAERFALALAGALRKAEREFGDGFVSTVLVDFIADSDLTRYPELAEVLKHAIAPALDHEGRTDRSYHLCREMVADAIVRGPTS